MTQFATRVFSAAARRFAAATVAAALALPLSATTYVVDAANGPGTNFTTIGAAVAAASPGDVILVRAGVYVENVVLNTGITIIGWNAQSYPLVVPSNPYQDVVWGTLLVQNLPAGHRVVVSGLTFARPSAQGGFTFGVDQCAGAVVFDRMFTPNGGFYVGDSTDVFMQNVRIRHVQGSDPPVPGVYVTNANLQANELDATASDLGTEPFFYSSAPNCLEARNGAVVCLSRPKLIGATGGGPWTTTPATPGGGAAIFCSASAVSVISNGSGLFYLIGGQGGVRGFGSAPTIASGFGSPAIVSEEGGVVLLKGAPAPVPGPPGANQSGGPTGIAYPGTLTFTGGVVQTNPQLPATLRFVGGVGPGAASFLNYQAGGAFYPFILMFMPEYDLSVFAPSVQFLGGVAETNLFYFISTVNAARSFSLGLNFPPATANLSGASLIVQGADLIAGTFYLTNPISLTLP
jgi:hypothetical protein